MGTLYLVATPIGNLEDITLRALQVLQQAALIAAEDTRQTQKLLQRYEIATPMVSYHEHNKLAAGRLREILAALENGDVALVSDAGMPGLNDPGYELVGAALEAGLPVSAIPGASAPITALVVSGLPTDAFLYLGYLPRRPAERRRRLQEVSEFPYTLILLETPHRLVEALGDLETILGNRLIAVARELTKLHEEIFRGSLQQARLHFQQNEPRGEFTLVVSGRSAEPAGPWNEERLVQALREGLSGGQPQSRLASELAAKSGWARRDVYQKISEIKQAD
ncbi:MAG: 16S rRNA (cytidine(1402)-2'-O)-methyltransferase [Chloroflexi bacterium]|nr:MAG: 16S rRNA (cytidine(1402)-2'-O)-methyltransferase [Chloroflexota bacterium]